MDFFERYVYIHRLGGGGMGQVYLALDKKLNKKWAIKEICLDNTVSAAGAVTELNVLKGLNHRLLPRIVDVCVQNNMAYLVMDYLEGITLKEKLRTEKPMKPEAAADMGLQLCEALAYLHKRKNPLIYRDLKPSNIICRSDGTYALVDFGAVVLLSQNSSSYALGTIEYAAPEQYKGLADERSDIYALGKILMEAIGSDRRAGLIKGVAKRCIYDNPDKRYQSADELRNALNGCKSVYGLCKRRSLAVFFLVLILTLGGFLSYGHVQTINNSNEEPENISTEIGEDNAYESAAKDIEEMTDNYTESLETIVRLQDSAREHIARENYSQASLGKALLLLEESEEIIKGMDDKAMDCKKYEMENLSMTATIYKLLGKQSKKERDKYYGEAMEYIERLLPLLDREDELYKLKILDLVGINKELGDRKAALSWLKRWEAEHPDDGAELYYAHMCMLLEGRGQEDEVKELFERIELSENLRGDFRFKEVSKQVKLYLEEAYK